MLDLFNDQVVSVDYLRDQGFLNGMGIVDEVDPSGNGNEPATGAYSGGEYEIVCHEPTDGAVDGGRSGDGDLPRREPRHQRRVHDQRARRPGCVRRADGGRQRRGVLIVSVDGGCDPGLRLVSEGVIGATAQQYPGEMATLGMQAIKDSRRRWSATGGDRGSRLLQHRRRTRDRQAGRRRREHHASKRARRSAGADLTADRERRWSCLRARARHASATAMMTGRPVRSPRRRRRADPSNCRSPRGDSCP